VIELAILGLLKDQPLHGYELKKRLGEMLGFLWGVSYGSLYPALKRLEREGAIEVVATGVSTGAPIPATGSISGEAAAARLRRLPTPGRRNKKAYRITPKGDEVFARLLTAPDTGADAERIFTLKFAFCRHFPASERVELLERRRAELADRLVKARRSVSDKGDRYTRSLMEHRTRSVERDLEWVDELILAERQQPPAHQEEATR
jgi:DNA-binding PadR family transcriptional regulator